MLVPSRFITKFESTRKPHCEIFNWRKRYPPFHSQFGGGGDKPEILLTITIVSARQPPMSNTLRQEILILINALQKPMDTL